LIRILRIIARLNIGGPAIQAISLSEAFSGNKYETLLVSGRIGEHEGNMSYLAKESGVNIVYLKELGREIFIWDDLKALFKLFKIIREYDPQIIHTHTAKAGTLGRIAGICCNLLKLNQKKIQMVHTFHGHVFDQYFSSIKTRLFIIIEKVLAIFTKRIIVISPLQKRDICYRYRISKSNKVRTIPLGFDLNQFKSKLEQKSDFKKYVNGHFGDSFLVGTVGRLVGIKNHRMLIDAALVLKERGSLDPFGFIIIGDGEFRLDLQKYVKKLGLNHHFLFAGWQRHMPAIYESLDMVVLTSLNEGTPVSLIESMAAGTPVVSTDVGGVRDLFGRELDRTREGFKITENGILIPSQSPQSLAMAITFIKENQPAIRKLTQNAKRFVLKTYTRERLIKDMENLYSELIN